MLCFPLALIDCLQQEKHRLSPLAGALLSDVIITPMLSEVLYSSRKRAFISTTQRLFNKMKIWRLMFLGVFFLPCLLALCLNGLSLLWAVQLHSGCVRSIQCVSLLPGWGIREGACVRARGKSRLSLPLIFCVQTTNDHKSAAFTVFLRPDVELQAERDKGMAGWWSPEQCRAGVSSVSWELWSTPAHY